MPGSLDLIEIKGEKGMATNSRQEGYAASAGVDQEQGERNLKMSSSKTPEREERKLGRDKGAVKAGHWGGGGP